MLTFSTRVPVNRVVKSYYVVLVNPDIKPTVVDKTNFELIYFTVIYRLTCFCLFMHV